jgi:hypothetical protein
LQKQRKQRGRRESQDGNRPAQPAAGVPLGEDG